MAIVIKRLGDYIQDIDERAGKSGGYSLKDIRGISSITKLFQKTKANLVDVSPAGYKVVKPMQFAFNPNTARMGDKIPIALNLEGKDIIVSSIYPVFQIKDTNQLDPQYLWLWFKRPEFDRYARFKSHGSAREIFSWEEMKSVKLPIPDINTQRKIVKQYNAAIASIDSNNKIIEKNKRLGILLLRKALSERTPDIITVSEIGDIVGGSTPSTERTDYWENGTIPWISPVDMPRTGCHINTAPRMISELGYKSTSTKMLPKGSILYSSRAPIGLTAINNIELCTNQGFKSIIPKKEYGTPFTYFLMLNEGKKMAKKYEGSTFAEVSGSELARYEVAVPSLEAIEGLNEKMSKLLAYSNVLEKENDTLANLANTIVKNTGRSIS